MIKKIPPLITCLIFLTTISNAQVEISAGMNAGGGFISANSPDNGAFITSIFVDAYLTPQDYLSTRLGFIYATDFNSIVPGSDRDYYPSVKGFFLKGIYSFYKTYSFYMEQGLGLIALNDRIYSDRNNWDYGISVSLMAGIDLRENTLNGFKTGLGLEYGTTFVNYSIQFYSVHFQVQYIF